MFCVGFSDFGKDGLTCGTYTIHCRGTGRSVSPCIIFVLYYITYTQYVDVSKWRVASQEPIVACGNGGNFPIVPHGAPCSKISKCSTNLEISGFSMKFRYELKLYTIFLFGSMKRKLSFSFCASNSTFIQIKFNYRKFFSTLLNFL